MRGGPEETKQLFSYVDIEERIAGDHPLRAIRALVEEALEELSAGFSKLYSHTGRPSIPPEQLLKASLLQAFFPVRSERQLMEQINYNILFRWFVGLSLDDRVWDASSFSKNRERLMQADVAKAFMGMPYDRHEIAMTASLDAKYTEPGIRVMERHAFDTPSKDFGF